MTDNDEYSPPNFLRQKALSKTQMDLQALYRSRKGDGYMLSNLSHIKKSKQDVVPGPGPNLVVKTLQSDNRQHSENMKKEVPIIAGTDALPS